MIRRIFGILCASIFAVATVSQLVSTLRARPLVAFASSLERADGVAPPDARLLERLRSEIGRRDGCERSLARSRVTASLFLLRHSDPEDAQEQHRMLVLAEEEARAALICNPLDGNLWFVAGWLGFQLAPNAGLLREHVLSAIRHSPYHGSALESRWRMLAPRLSALGFAGDPRIAADLERLYRLSAPRTVAAIHDALVGNGGEATALAMLEGVSAERRTALERAIRANASVAAPRQFLRFERRAAPEHP